MDLIEYYVSINTMDKLKKGRAPTRGIITKTINELEAELLVPEKNIIKLKAWFERLNDLQQKIQEIHQLIFNEMLADPDTSEEQQLQESITCEDILTRIVMARLMIDAELEKATDDFDDYDYYVSAVNVDPNSELNRRQVHHQLISQHFIGSNLFGSGIFSKHCFSVEDVALLATRSKFESLLPNISTSLKKLENDKSVEIMLKYFYGLEELLNIIQREEVKFFSQQAFYDAFGGIIGSSDFPIAVSPPSHRKNSHGDESVVKSADKGGQSRMSGQTKSSGLSLKELIHAEISRKPSKPSKEQIKALSRNKKSMKEWAEHCLKIVMIRYRNA
ncbi:hypothetical protein Bhyg_11908 [Pseudolycoriella hygida]|uniref:Uncharacterized protein n=1 Tax=Pseudolycoriella hygida TaxID=35572 RepID=A0A9Q0S0S2_9DIPT|nr:hypothetical protein Bhyg_11908 [Pseudolycoriella hygida]